MNRSEFDGSPTVLHATTVGETLLFLAGFPDVLRAAGYEMHIASSPGRPAERFALEEDVQLHPILMSRRITPLADALALSQFWRLMRQLRPSIVHSHTPKAGLLAMIAGSLVRVPVRIYHVHGLPWETARGPRRAVLRSADWIACRLATRVLCVSPSIREILIDSKLCAPDKAESPLHGSVAGVDAGFRFDPDRLTGSASVIRKRLGIESGSLVVGYVGRIVKDKGIVELASAWEKLRADFPNLHLLLLGPEERQDPVPAITMEFLRHDKRVHMIGWVDEPAPYYAVMDILALPTYREGFGLAALEAAAMRVPVVATRIAGCVDAVAEGQTGLLVTPGDAAALGGALRRYLVNDGERRMHGEAGRARALRDFAQERMWFELLKSYKNQLGDRRSA